jgi:hypothetical protein
MTLQCGGCQVARRLGLDKSQRSTICELRTIFLEKLQSILLERKALHAAIVDSLPQFINARHTAVQYLKVRRPSLVPSYNTVLLGFILSLLFLEESFPRTVFLRELHPYVSQEGFRGKLLRESPLYDFHDPDWYGDRVREEIIYFPDISVASYTTDQRNSPDGQECPSVPERKPCMQDRICPGILK